MATPKKRKAAAKKWAEQNRDMGLDRSSRAAAGPSHQRKKQTILGLDFGSAGTRASLIRTDAVSDGHPLFHDIGDWEGQLPANGPLFPWQRFEYAAGIDPASNLVGPPAIRGGTKPIGLKFYIYELARAAYTSDPAASLAIERLIKNTVPHDIVAFGLEREASHLDQVRDLIVRYFRSVRARVDEYCESGHYVYDKIAVTIPATWDGPLQQTYAEILEHAWGGEADSEAAAAAAPGGAREDKEIVFVYEAEAIGHYMLCATENHHLRNQELNEVMRGKFQKVMFVDFGGHTVSGTTFVLRHKSDADGSPLYTQAFYSSSPAWGCPGGVELYSFLVEDAIRADPAIIALPDDRRDTTISEFMDNFRDKQRKNRGAWEQLTCDYATWKPVAPGSDGDGDVEMADGEPEPESGGRQDPAIQRLYERAFREPLNFIKSKIQEEFDEGSGESTLVVLNGGSYFNRFALEETSNMVKQLEGSRFGLHCLNYDQHIMSPLGTPCDNIRETLTDSNKLISGLVVAQGAALAVANQLSVADFMSQGAAFGVQGGKNLILGKVVMDRGDPQSASVRITSERAPPKIICNPFAATMPIISAHGRSGRSGGDGQGDGDGGHKGKGSQPVLPEFENNDSRTNKARPISYRVAYNFLELPARKPGNYQYEMSMVGEDAMELKETRQVERKMHERRWVLPVYFDPGQRVVMVDRDKFDEKELVRDGASAD